MKTLVLLRHGESAWNLENRFTGWTDVDLTPKGIREAHEAARLLGEGGYTFDVCFTSVLKRAIRTLWIVLDDMDLMWLTVHKSWRLNERHYGALQGLNKAETTAQYGEKQVLVWRRSYADPPPPLKPDDPRHPGHDRRYADVPPAQLPLTESLKDTVARFLPYWHERILPEPRGDRRPRQQPARAGQVPRRGVRGGNRRPEHPDRHPARLRAPGRPETHSPLLPGGSGGGAQGRGGGGEPGRAQALSRG